MSSHYKNFRRLINILHFAVFILFLYSAITKSLDFDLFVNTLDKSPFFLNINTKAIAIAVIVLEIIIPIFLFFELTSKIGYFLSFFSLFLFTGYILMMMKFSPYLPCSCGGLIELLSWTQHIYINIVFMIISALLFFKSSKI